MACPYIDDSSALAVARAQQKAREKAVLDQAKVVGLWLLAFLLATFALTIK